MHKILTVLVCLKDRSTFTERLFNYLSMIKYPYTVFFADGSLGDEHELFFRNKQNREVDFHFIYKRYPKDISLEVFYKKCYASILKVNTPYVMLADNDDFVVPEGQEKCIEFLNNNPDYVGCNGRVPGVVLSPFPGEAYGKHIQYLAYYCNVMDKQVLVDQASACKRIQSYIQNFYSIFYSVFRTESLVNTFKNIQEFNFSDLGIVELFLSYMQLAQGKIHSIQEVTYIRQKGSSYTAAMQKDWFHRLFYTNWLSDCKVALRSVSSLIATKEGLNENTVYEELYENLSTRLRNRYIHNDFHILKNADKLLTKEKIKLIFLNKIFKKFPSVGEALSLGMKSKHHLRFKFNRIKEAIQSCST